MTQQADKTVYCQGWRVQYFDASHSYRATSPDGKKSYRVPGCTGVVGAADLGKSKSLPRWAARMASEYADEMLREHCGEVLDPSVLDDVVHGMKDAHYRKMTAAGDAGSIAHDWIEQWFNALIVGEDPPAEPPAGQDQFRIARNFYDWQAQRKPVPLLTEQVVFDPELFWAGQFDLLCMIDGVLTVVDWKTSNYFGVSYFIQCAAYAKALKFRDDLEYDTPESVRIVMIDLKRNQNNFEEEVLDAKQIDEAYDIFRCCHRIKAWHKANDPWEKNR